MQKHKDYDYIVVGAGSAGAIVAARLSEDPQTKVLLVEYGGGDHSVFIRMPSALGIPMNTDKYNWGFQSVPEPYLNNRIMNCPRGKVMGGPHRLMAWSMCAAMPMITMSGKPMVPVVGIIRIACRILKNWRLIKLSPVSTPAVKGR